MASQGPVAKVAPSYTESTSLNSLKNLSPPVEETRFRVARWVIFGYLGLLAGQIILTLLLTYVVWDVPSANQDILRDVVDLLNGLSATTAVFGGLAGVAIGFYFRS